MNTFFKHLSIRQLMLIQGMAVVILFSAAAFGFIIPGMYRYLEENRKDRLREITEVGVGILTSMNDRCLRGELNLPDARKQAAVMIRSLRYGPGSGEYLWIQDFSPTVIAHPYRTDLEGANVSGITDAGGRKVFVELAETCALNGEGFADFTWSSNNDNLIVPGGAAFVKAYRPWGWIVGTGIRNGNPRVESWAVYGKAALIFMVIAGISIFMLFVSSGFVSGPIRKTSEWLRESIDGRGDLTKRFEAPPGKELEEFSVNLNEFKEVIHQMVRTVKETSERLFESAQILQLSSESSAETTEKQVKSSLEIKALADKASAAMDTITARLENLCAEIQTLMAGIKALPVNGLELEKTIEEMKHTADKISILSEQEILRLKSVETALKKNEINKTQHLSAVQQAENQIREIGRSAATVDLLVRLVSEKAKFQALSVTDLGQRIMRITGNVDGFKSALAGQQAAMREIVASIGILSEFAGTSADNAASIAGNAEEIKGLAYRLTSESQNFRV